MTTGDGGAEDAEEGRNNPADQAETESHREGSTISRRSAWWTAVGVPVVAFLAGVTVAAVGSKIAADTSSDAIRDSDLRTARMAAYGAYLAEHSEFHELIWSQTPWSGVSTEAKYTDPFWTSATLLQSRLASANAQAVMVAGDDKQVSEPFTSLHDDQVATLLRFKCMADIQDECTTSSEETIAKASNEAIRQMLRDWTTRAQERQSDLLAAAGRQLT